VAVMNRVRTVWTGVAGVPYYTTHYFTDDATLTTAQDAVSAVNTLWTNLASIIYNGLTWTVDGAVARINAADGALVGQWGAAGATGVGTDAGELLPRQAQGGVRLDTGAVVSGRLLRGRTFVPGACETRNGPTGVPTAAYIASLSTNFQALVADAGNELLVWSRTHGVANPVTTTTAQGKWFTLNSRRD
jgi:hypothetical protein